MSQRANRIIASVVIAVVSLFLAEGVAQLFFPIQNGTFTEDAAIREIHRASLHYWTAVVVWFAADIFIEIGYRRWREQRDSSSRLHKVNS